MDEEGLFDRIRRFFRIKNRVRPDREIKGASDDGNESGEQNGIIDGDEDRMLDGLLQFRETVVREVMIPRTEISAVGLDAGISQAVEEILESGHSRIPIYEESIDRIAGLVYAKDLLRCLKEGRSQIPLREIMRSPYFIPETKNVQKLLSELKVKRLHMAIVIDEYGGTSGLVTLEDLIEEIVGEIEDEYDFEEEKLVEVSPGEILVPARLEIDEIEDYFGLELDEGNFTTVGGWIASNIGRIPKNGEHFQFDDLQVRIEQADERRVRKVRIMRAASSDNGVQTGPD